MSSDPADNAGGPRGPLLLLVRKPLAFADRLLGLLTSGGSAIGTVWIVGLMVLINADILGRVLFNAPLTGTPELVTLSIIGIVFLQLPDAARRRSLTRSESLMDFVMARAPRTAQAIAGLYELIGLALFGILAWVTFPQAVEAWVRAEFIGNPGLLTVPTWPLLGLIVLGSGLLAAQFAANACRAFLLAFRSAAGSDVR